MSWIRMIAFRKLKQLCVAGLVVALCIGQPALCSAAWAVLSPKDGDAIGNATDLPMNGTGTPISGATYHCRLFSDVSMVWEGDGGASFMMDGWMGQATRLQMFYTSGPARAQIWQFVPGSGWAPKAQNDVTVN